MNAKQNEAFDSVMKGNNIFITGPGGTGKSYLIEQIVRSVPSTMRVAVTALTGCAALLLGAGARTIHSWAGIGLGRDSAAVLAQQIHKYRHKSPSYKNWVKTDMLIIDEISMMTPELFEKLDIIGRKLRLCDRPFGGIQLVLVGDFYQLPPIVGNNVPDNEKFVFLSPLWREAVQQVIQLDEIVRQKDPAFQDLLLAVRRGALSDQHLKLLQERCGLDWDAEQIKPTLLFSRRFDVDTINDANIRALKPGRTIYTVKTVIEENAPAHSSTITKGPEFEKYVALYDKAAPYETELTLAEGAQVMLIYNMDIELGLANGSRGVITGFKAGLPVVLFKNGVEITIGNHSWPLDDYKGISRAQIPLQLAWAQTTHKSQGATLDCASIDIGSNVFEYGQAYVALSRVRSLESLYISSLNPRAIRAHPRVIEYYEGLAG